MKVACIFKRYSYKNMEYVRKNDVLGMQPRYLEMREAEYEAPPRGRHCRETLRVDLKHLGAW